MSQVPAATITVRETLGLLDADFRSFAEGVSEDRYALWLGSGISLGRMDGLGKLVSRILEFLRSRVTPGDPGCRYLKALREALNLAGFAEDAGGIDLARPFLEWPDATAISDRLILQYARFLEITVEGEPEDFLLWHGAAVATTFADPDAEPDVEHICIAVLVLEGVASDIASANWDGLIEKAAELVGRGHPSLVVCVRPEDLREAALRARLFKFHGCAVKARTDEETYRPLLIGRLSQITGWTARPENAAMVNRLVGLVTTKPTLMLGLSAQDANVQAIFAEAEAQMPWPWPGDRPSYVFSEDKLGIDQRGLLQNVYRGSYSVDTRDKILSASLIRAYAKPLLVALVLYVLAAKLRELVALALGGFPQEEREGVQAGILQLRNELASNVGPELLTFVLALVDHISRAQMLFRSGSSSPSTERAYNPVTRVPIQQIAGDPGLKDSGLLEGAVALALVGLLIREGAWAVGATNPNEQTGGVLRVTSKAGSAKLFFCANTHVALGLRHHGHVVEADDVVLIHSVRPIQPFARSPRGAPGRTGRVKLREVSISRLLAEVATSGALVRRLREEVGL